MLTHHWERGYYIFSEVRYGVSEKTGAYGVIFFAATWFCCCKY